MINCKHCNAEMEENNSFCSNCGNIIAKNNENIVLSTLKILGKGFINPASYIRNAKNSNIISTGILAVAIILLGIIKLLIFNSANTGRLLSLYGFKSWSLILLQLIALAVNIGIMYLVLKITNQRADIMECVNIIIFSNILISIFAFVGTTILYFSTTLAALIIAISVGIYYLLIFHGLREGLNIGIKKSIIILISCLVGSGIVTNIIIRLF